MTYLYALYAHVLEWMLDRAGWGWCTPTSAVVSTIREERVRPLPTVLGGWRKN
jgi:hypothetical protein